MPNGPQSDEFPRYDNIAINMEKLNKRSFAESHKDLVNQMMHTLILCEVSLGARQGNGGRVQWCADRHWAESGFDNNSEWLPHTVG